MSGRFGGAARNELQVLAPDGVPEVVTGDDLAALVLSVMELQDGDIGKKRSWQGRCGSSPEPEQQ